MTRSSRRPPRRRISTTRKNGSPDPTAGRNYKIGEAAELIGVKPFVLRFWESEFPHLRPGHTQSKHRRYDERAIEALLLVKRLLHEERFTIEGAKRRIKELGAEAAGAKVKTSANSGARAAESQMKRVLGEIRKDLLSLLKLIDS